MATSVYLASTGTQTHRVFRVGATVAAQNFATGAVFYTVPGDKRLVMKGDFSVAPDWDGTNHRAKLDGKAGDVEYTFVFPPGSRLMLASSPTEFVATGFLEDDV